MFDEAPKPVEDGYEFTLEQDSLANAMGARLPNRSLWMVQGEVGGGKSLVSQRLIFGLLENGSKILASSTSASSIRGGSFSLVYLDEFAFVDATLQEEFFASVYPTISSGATSRVMITSTPKGMNLFYKLWVDAEEGRNEYVPIQVHWSAVPGRDEEWKEQTIKNTSEEQFRQEFECDFIGSSNTLINPSKLAALTFHEPISQNENMKIWKEIKQNLLELFSKNTDLQKMMRARTRFAGEEKDSGKAIVPRVQVEKESAVIFTIIRVEARDHMGMLYKIASVFADFGILIHRAKISTQGNRGIDVFYVSLKEQHVTFNKLMSQFKANMIKTLMIEKLEDVP